MKRRLALLPAVVLAATALTGCAGSQERPDTLRVVVANFPADHQGQSVLKTITDTFHKSHPNIKVEADFVPYDNLNAKISTSLAAGTTYDVISAGIGWVQPLADLGAIRSLEGQGFSTAQLERKVYPSFVPPMLHKNKLYAVPVVANPRLLAYSKSAFRKAGLDPDRPPRSLGELRAFAKKLTVRNARGQITQTGFDFWAEPSNYRQQFVQFLGAAGGELFKGSTPLFNSPEGIRALSLMRDMISKDKSSQYGYQNSAQTSLVTAGQAGMGFVSPYVDCSNGEEGIGRKKCDDLVYFTLKDRKSAMFTGGRIAAMGAQTELKGPAADLIRAFQNRKSQEAISALDVGVPVDKSAATSDFVKNNPAGSYAVDHLDASVFEYGGANFLDFRGGGGAAVDEAILKKKSPADALASLDTIARNRK